MNKTAINSLSSALSALIASEDGIRVEIADKRVLVGFWFECAIGRTYVCAHGETFQDALASAKARRAAKTKEAKVEAEIRAEVEARMARAA